MNVAIIGTGYVGLVDARNVLDPVQARALGFAYFCTGRERAGALEAVGV